MGVARRVPLGMEPSEQPEHEPIETAKPELAASDHPHILTPDALEPEDDRQDGARTNRPPAQPAGTE